MGNRGADRPRPRQRALHALDWSVCMLLPPLGVVWACWNIAGGNARMARKRLAVSLFSMATVVSIWMMLGMPR